MLYEPSWYMPLLKYSVWFVPVLMFVTVVLAGTISYGYTFCDWKKKNQFVIPLMCFAFVLLSFGPVVLFAWFIGHE